MTPAYLQSYLHAAIPQSASLHVSVEKIAADSLTLSAPLEPNINHQHSVFGGSASSVAILSAWALVHHKLATEGIKAELVIRKNTMNYHSPILGRFLAVATGPAEERWNKFLRTFERRDMAGIEVSSELLFDGSVAGRFTGNFVAIRPQQ